MARALIVACLLALCLLANSTPLTLNSVLAKLHADGLKQFKTFSSAKQNAIVVEMQTLGMHEQDIDTIRFGPSGAVSRLFL